MSRAVTTWNKLGIKKCFFFFFFVTTKSRRMVPLQLVLIHVHTELKFKEWQHNLLSRVEVMTNYDLAKNSDDYNESGEGMMFEWKWS